ncbi:MAG: hypothetical protein HOW73_22540 [Polyangiaceae bacterium]|nr:hypothetical protein [Polyangiaceae bacterium]
MRPAYPPSIAADLCQKHGVVPQPPARWSKVGVALATLDLDPLNGVRHSPDGATCGWFIWGGAGFSEDPDFFQPLHIAHLVKRCPRALRFLSLPPGWRFLLGANDYEDVWHDDAVEVVK